MTEIKIGDTFGRWTVIGDSIIEKHARKYLCKCGCEKQTVRYVLANGLKSGRSKSCGCYRSDLTHERCFIHGEIRTRLYNTWIRMRDRCNNPNNKEYKNYGGRGIKVCDEWEHSYESFKKWAYENGYDEKLKGIQSSIDRIDNNSGYSPDNCRWADMYTQCNNRSSNKYITYNGKTQTFSQWGREFGIKPHTIRYRYVLGYDLDDVFYQGNLNFRKTI